MKKLLMLLALLAPTMAFAAGQDISIGSASALAGATISVPVTADITDQVIAAQFLVHYDPALLTPTTVALGSGTQGWGMDYNPAVSGIIRVGMFTSTAITGTGKQLALVNFTVNASPGTTLLPSPNLTLTEAVFNTTAITTIANGNFTLIILGDVNGDSKVDMADAAAISKAVVGLTTLTPEQAKLADVNVDGIVSMYDAALIAQLSVGEIIHF